jgi:hypothetical protein
MSLKKMKLSEFAAERDQYREDVASWWYIHGYFNARRGYYTGTSYIGPYKSYYDEGFRDACGDLDRPALAKEIDG